jgi:tubulin monoglycylase TTLL3/8
MGTADLESSMWDRQTFQQYISENYGEDRFKTLLGKMKEIVVATILGTVDQISARKGSFEQLGYDMMIDENLNPWLIEVNSSPAMDYSTPITRKLVKMVMEDIVKVVIDLHKKKNKSKSVGQFKLIYSGNEPFKTKYYRIGCTDRNDEE